MKTALVGVEVCIVLCILLNVVRGFHAENVMFARGVKGVNSKKSDSSGSCGDKVRWTLIYDKLIIEGNGQMTNFASELDVPWYDKIQQIGRIEIEEGVTSIGDYAFFKSAIKEISIPSSVKSIGNYAFYSCEELTRPTIPSSVNALGSFAFSRCSRLESIVIPSSVSSIGSGAFSHCELLASIHVEEGNKNYSSIDGVLVNLEQTDLLQYPAGRPGEQYLVPEGITSIENDAFAGNEMLRFLTLSNSLNSIGDHSFLDCRMLANMYIPVNVASIGTAAFQGCDSLASIEVDDENDHFSSIDGVLFNRNYSALIRYPPKKDNKEYTIPNGVKSIEDAAFYRCPYLNKVVLSDTVSSIGTYAFSSCNSLTDCSVGSDLKTIGYGAFSSCGLLSFTIGSNVEFLGDRAFQDCSRLKKLSIPRSVKSIGSEAFLSCFGLSSIDVEDGSDYFTSIEGVLFNHDGTSLIRYPAGKTVDTYSVPDCVETIESGAFEWASKLVTVVFSDGVESIGDNAFSGCSSLVDITIGSKVTSIGDFAFSSCYHLSSVIFSESLVSIGNYAFNYCPNLKKVTIPKNVRSIGAYAFGSCRSLTSIDVEEENEHFKSIDGVLFDHELKTLVRYPEGNQSKSYVVPDDVTTIGDHSFSSCSHLIEIALHDNVKWIGIGSFQQCNSLHTINIPDTVSFIGHFAFLDCSLTDIRIGNGVNSIGHYAFYGSGITTITIKKDVESIGFSAFECCADLESINVEEENKYYKSVDGVLFNNEKTILVQYPLGKSGDSYTIPDSVTLIGDSSFDYCTDPLIISGSKRTLSGRNSFVPLANVIIPDSVTAIGRSAFRSRLDLERVVIGSNVKSIGRDAFFYCVALTDLTIPESVQSIGNDAFYGCSALSSVFYLGSHGMSSDAFRDCDILDMVCVSPDYSSSSFCGRELNSTADECKSFRSRFNHCYKPKYVNGELIDEMRDNASEWVSRTDSCIEYLCDNESGGIGRSKCNNTEEITHICVEGQCVTAEKEEERDGWIVEMDLEDVVAIEMNISEVMTILKELTGIDELTLGYAIDKDGYVRLIVYVNDEDSANRVSEAIKGIPKGTDCSYGVLCRSRNVRVKENRSINASNGNQPTMEIVMMAILFVSMMLKL